MAKAINAKNLKQHQDRLAAHRTEVGKLTRRQEALEQVKGMVEKTSIEQMSDADVRTLLKLVVRHLGIY